ncbi:restriction endonuclease [Chryseobacterium lathyri]|uniref:restriction endonuclease n=1 Tax=Chryseobacterium lathyri TaxID=395933 RepID=UPI002786FB3C|nr:restriction endonuclease [Chryseobacterium lathyri]MDQ0067867.1 HJR/Mrr/RecB family endonuclease [Chryseobacterium lathyri]
MEHKRIFIGREEELNQLEDFVIKKKKKLIAITGNNATGKTYLWQEFIKQTKLDGNSEIQVFNFNNSHSLIKSNDISTESKIIIFDDLSYISSFRLVDNLKKIISKHSEKQFIIVSPFQNLVKNFELDLHIHLDSFDLNESRRLFEALWKNNLETHEADILLEITKGNPLLINLSIDLLNSKKYNVQQIVRLLSENLKIENYVSTTNNIIVEKTPEIVQLTSDIKIINQSIIDSVRNNPFNIYNLNPREFEEFVAELLTKKGYNVDLTKMTRDGGKDLIIAESKDIGNFLYYVECKKYSQNNPVGIKLVRELAGTITADRVTAGIFVTSSYFSQDAVNFSEKFKNQISLIDFIKLKQWLNQL